MSYTHTMHALASAYDTAITEKKWQDYWLTQNTYAWDANTPRAQSYVIDTPPPTVSGQLHMGHVFSYTQADFIARYQRMKGMNVFYPMGFDDNGLPTERLVEKAKKIRAADVGREKFIEECESVAEEARQEFRALFQSIALSVDWAQEYHTISDDCRRLSQTSFLDLVKKGDVYRKLQPMLWDPVDQTAIAQAEVVDKELPSHFCDIAFTCEETGEELIIGTTRPELIPACVALFYNPEDARYTKLKGKHARVPLFGFSVDILEDPTVEIEKGTGLMMCCTFGDEKDIEKWQKHNLPTRMIINKYGKIDLALALDEGQYPENFGWPVPLFEQLNAKKVSNADTKHPGAREIIITALEEAGLLREKKPIVHAVKTAERSGAVLELIPTHQWFVKVLDKKKELKEKARECNWNPDWMRVRIEQWIDGLNWDWCISRQRYFGVPFPVWYLKTTNHTMAKLHIITADPAQLPINPLTSLPKGLRRREDDTSSDYILCDAEDDIQDIEGNIVAKKGDTALFLYPDFDVMDTWATSSISPQMNAGAILPHPTPLPEGEGTSAARGEGDRFNKLFPADLRPQAHEIIRTWAFYTIVKAYLHEDKAIRDEKGKGIPWKNLMISGWCLAEDKTKMSKSKGNVVTPVDLITERGTDAVRYWAATSRLGQDTAFSPDLLKIGKKLVGKLWNATQFAAIHLSKLETAPAARAVDDKAITEVLDQWIISRLHDTVQKATEAFERYEYADALDATNSFFWADLCDNYLELIKKRVYNEDGSFTKAQQLSAVHTLYHVLKGFLKLYAPVVPHVTEELYSHIFADEYAKTGSLHGKNQWPNAADYPRFDGALQAGDIAVALLEAMRKAKSEAKVSIKYPVKELQISLTHDHQDVSDDQMLDSIMDDVLGAGNAEHYSFKKAPNPHAQETIWPAFAAQVVLADRADAA